MLSERSGTVPHTDATADGLLSSLEESGSDISVVLPVVTKPSQFVSITKFASEVNKLRGIISFGGMHPDTDDVDGQLDTIVNAGLPGIKLHPDYQGVFIDDDRYVKIITGAVERGLSSQSTRELIRVFPVRFTARRNARRICSILCTATVFRKKR